MNIYQPDTLAQFSTTFTRFSDKAPVDPTTVVLYVQTPDGTITEYSDAVKTSVGNYEKQLLLNQIGVWVYKWQGTGAVEVTSVDGYLNVEESVVFSP